MYTSSGAIHERSAHQSSIDMTDEASLIQRILAGQHDVFATLIEPHRGALSRMIRAKMGNHSDVDDIVQQATFKAFAHLRQFRFEASFKSWLTRIAINEVVQRRRFGSRLVALDPSVIAQIQVFNPGASPFELCARNEIASLVQTAVANLPQIYRDVIRMRDFEECSVSEVADKLSLTTTAVKTRHHRGRLRMARIIRERISVRNGLSARLR